MNALTGKQMFELLSACDLNRVVFVMPDGLPIVDIHVDGAGAKGAIVTLSDEKQIDAS